MEYSDKVMDYFMNPKNMGTMEEPDGVGEVGNPSCGDQMTIQIKVEDDRIVDIKFKTFGCAAAIATSSMVTELARNKTLDEALQLTNQEVEEELGGLPPIKRHCSLLAEEGLEAAIENYRSKQEGNS